MPTEEEEGEEGEAMAAVPLGETLVRGAILMAADGRHLVVGANGTKTTGAEAPDGATTTTTSSSSILLATNGAEAGVVGTIAAGGLLLETTCEGGRIGTGAIVLLLATSFVAATMKDPPTEAEEGTFLVVQGADADADANTNVKMAKIVEGVVEADADEIVVVEEEKAAVAMVIPDKKSDSGFAAGSIGSSSARTPTISSLLRPRGSLRTREPA
jgi:hypothetical protein